jgi:hypothetical protein
VPDVPLPPEAPARLTSHELKLPDPTELFTTTLIAPLPELYERTVAVM